MKVLHRGTLAKLRVLVQEAIDGEVLFPTYELGRLRADLDSVLKPSLKAKAARSARAAEKKTKKAAKNSETSEIRRLVFERAGGRCEGRLGDIGRCDRAAASLDHFFGRAKAPQSVANCWALCVTCDRGKTNNAPSAADWLHWFIAHCHRHGYFAEASRAERDHRSKRSAQ